MGHNAINAPGTTRGASLPSCVRGWLGLGGRDGVQKRVSARLSWLKHEEGSRRHTPALFADLNPNPNPNPYVGVGMKTVELEASIHLVPAESTSHWY